MLTTSVMYMLGLRLIVHHLAHLPCMDDFVPFSGPCAHAKNTGQTFKMHIFVRLRILLAVMAMT